jgi:hypothetical protein
MNRNKLANAAALIVLVVGVLNIQVQSQSLPTDFGTPQRTATLASTSGFIDILNIKLGMPAEAALATLKAAYPRASITFDKTQDYRGAWISNLPRIDPNRQFVTLIHVEPSLPPMDRVYVGLTIPPSKQVVHSISRETILQAPVAIENIVAGLRKKYGMESAGIDFKPNGIAIFDGITKTLVWAYDGNGKQISAQALAKNNSGCAAAGTGGMGAPAVEIRRSSSDGRPYSPDQIKNNMCDGMIVMTAVISSDGTTQPGFRGSSKFFSLTVYDYPMIVNSANAFYAFLDQSAQQDARRAEQDAKQRGGEIKY